MTPRNVAAPGGPWRRIARTARQWAETESIEWRDAIVLVPFAQLLPHAREAFAAAGRWLPRIETTATLAASLGPAPPSVPGRFNFDPVMDALAAEAWLRGEGWGAEWARADPRGFERGVRLLVSTATQLARALHARAPEARAAGLVAARSVLQPVGGTGARERALARVALEWAALAAGPATDRLFELRPSAWIAIRAGGADPLVSALLESGSAPALVIDADAAVDPSAPTTRTTGAATLAVCDDFEAEAQRTAAQVLRHIEWQETPVALIAQDRLLVRRVRALLERHAVEVKDETGWKLSTTRAAAEVMSLLRAAAPDATTDALFDWLKSAASGDPAVDALERACRRGRIASRPRLASAELEPAPARMRAQADAVLEPLAGAARRSLADWLEALAAALGASGGLERLGADAAGQQVIAVLHLGTVAGRLDGAWRALAGDTRMSPGRFVAWVDRVLEEATFRPPTIAGGEAGVVVVPLAGALLRPFAAAVLPGADERHLGAVRSHATLLTEAEAEALGVPTAGTRRRDEALAFGHLLSLPRVSCLRRRFEGAEPLAVSPLVERLEATLAASGEVLALANDPRADLPVELRTVRMPAPAAADRLPPSLSASACEALRACPYRFHALYLLGLREAEELDRDPEKREYGNWLHEVLMRFHRERDAAAEPSGDLGRLHEAALATQRDQGLGEADFLPFAASFRGFAPRYLEWLHGRDADGARWLLGEERVEAVFADLRLHGVIDRIDERPGADGPLLELIDYKTGNAEKLKEKVREPFEDTQLALYAALVRSRSDAPLVAGYLPVDGRSALAAVVHPDVEASAAALVAGLGEDLRRLRAGAGLPALGSEEVCGYCAARGICRRDDWAPLDGAPPGA